MDRSADVAIVGGGIVGLAHAYMALRKGLRVVLFERDQFAVGASVRNFGLVWPIGQEPGEGLTRALRSREHWREITSKAGIWCSPSGSLHLAYADDEYAVLEEFTETFKDAGYRCQLIRPEETLKKSPVVRKEGLKGALWSETEMTVYAREAIRSIALWLENDMGLILQFGHVVTGIHLPDVETSRGSWKAERAVVCSGADFETLFPEEYERLEMKKCKLQMMRARTRKPVQIGPSLCAGLTLRHYAAFSKCKSLKAVDERLDAENVKLKQHGIHILVSQNNFGELIIGDSHQYFQTVEPFDSEEINAIILEYFEKFMAIGGQYEVIEKWHGVYPKINGNLNLLSEPQPRVQVVNGLGGAGMTLSFGLAEEIVSKW